MLCWQMSPISFGDWLWLEGLDVGLISAFQACFTGFQAREFDVMPLARYVLMPLVDVLWFNVVWDRRFEHYLHSITEWVDEGEARRDRKWRLPSYYRIFIIKQSKELPASCFVNSVSLIFVQRELEKISYFWKRPPDALLRNNCFAICLLICRLLFNNAQTMN